MTWVVRLVVLLPALAGLLGLLVHRRRRVSQAVAVGSALLVTVLAVLQWVGPLETSDVDTFGGLPLGDLSVPLHLLSDRLSGLVAAVVAMVVLAIQVFTGWYLRTDPRYGRFAATVSLFAAGMLLVVQSADLALTLVGWEIMGWCSWLLIGHENERAAARRAAYKAFVVTRVADIGMVVGLVALSVRARSTDLLDVLTVDPAVPALTVGLVGVAVGVAGKSGLVPFHDWLPDAMEGPAPASALIHAATMVAAGTYVIARLFPLYASHDGARTLLAVLAATTMVYAAALAFVQTDLKRLLAYSTLSQIAIMLGAIAAATPEAGPASGVSHLVGHAFFKALLFLAAGWLAFLAGATAMSALTGRLHRSGALRIAMGIGLASLAGVPPLVGFFTKDTVLDVALEGATDGQGLRAWLVLGALVVTIVLTAAYCTRAWLVLNAASGRPSGKRARISLPASLAVATLTALTVIGAAVLTTLEGALHVGVVTAAVSVLLVAGAALGVWTASHSGRRDAAEIVPARLRQGGARGFGVDTAYVRIGGAVTALARGVVALDRDVVDAYPRAAAAATRRLGQVGDRSHRGVPSLALLGLLVGVVVVTTLGVSLWR